jgi:hypothetical protein
MRRNCHNFELQAVMQQQSVRCGHTMVGRFIALPSCITHAVHKVTKGPVPLRSFFVAKYEGDVTDGMVRLQHALLYVLVC